ncbi:MAG: hypothetical protein LH624_07170 [Cryobacterium sp.]|nr:hypothetical protein [Cryobacterium sp.]
MTSTAQNARTAPLSALKNGLWGVLATPFSGPKLAVDTEPLRQEVRLFHSVEAAGAMTGFSHPEGLQAALNGLVAGGFARARASFTLWLPLANFEAQPGVGLALRKEILRRRGVISDAVVRAPAPALPPRLAALIDAPRAAAAVIGRA